MAFQILDSEYGDDCQRYSNFDSDFNIVQNGFCSSIGRPLERYKAYDFFKADPIPGQKPSWTKVDRIESELSQDKLSKKVHKRAKKVSAAHQYQMLSDFRQAHVNLLLHDLKQIYPQVDWSCVYAKERKRSSKARNANLEDFETVSMQVILMQRSLYTKTHPRTPMGELVDLRQFSATQEPHG
ncbi:uncharacterized protein N7483_002510 [Penicillium malachiteum]|uniref:uncharacterized protein n=1 Tax=Penicillium malachiteum TaxID=1324776 RepID=UPI002548314A|nr:uncharacterized protein N7483_002441 [Penicillium malachiteum]XP_056952096.1 uncharacterized protein N7483_002510 [Penicillium malachiteum]KAJ5737316.1 hypothetical protein N7483_002441 [Penicillium malachiteum]KAJ5737385.1 hypothetical protein N7483_002510 [Penicillium malachiteum]